MLSNGQKDRVITEEHYEKAENEYCFAKVALVAMLQPMLEPSSAAQHGARANNSGPRMKAIDPPSFSGEIEDWVSFLRFIRGSGHEEWFAHADPSSSIFAVGMQR